MSESAAQSLRLADLLAALSVTTDLGIGRRPQAAMQACLLATRLAGTMGLDPHQISDVYYASLLRYIGCTAYAHEEAIFAGGNELDGRAESTRIDFLNPREFLAFHLLHIGRHTPPLHRLATVALAIPRTLTGTRDLAASHCEVGTAMARRLGMSTGVREALEQIFERWDGKGFPTKLRGEALCLPLRFAHVATFAVAYALEEGVDTALEVVRRRAGKMFDPAIAEVFLHQGTEMLAEIAEEDAWMAAVAAEPEPHHRVHDADLEGIAHAFADMADLKTFFTRGHSPRVAELAETAGRRLHLSDLDIRRLRLAALFHDLGRVGIPNGIWEKERSLTAGDWEQVRLYPYHTERILARSPVLAPLSSIAGMQRELCDGSGYYRQLAGAGIPLSARILATADAYCAMTEERPYRPAHAAGEAARGLEMSATAGHLDMAVVRAVLEAAGNPLPWRRSSWPSGLSDREVEVLRLIARGSTYRDVGRELVISPRTAAHHVQHIYNKIGVSTRAAAAMFAMEHDLLAN